MTRLRSSIRLVRGSRRLLAITVSVVLLAVGATTAAVASSGGSSNPRHITAYFSRTIGLYNGNDVRILGVKVGKINSLTVEGKQVKAVLTLDGDNKLPAGVKAVVIPPSLVSDRYIELQPAYTSGPQLQDHAVLNLAQTAVPLEYDEIFKNLDQLNNALGPLGANKTGALSKLVRISAKNLHGNGAELNSALGEFSQAIATLSGSRGDLFGTVTSLQKFTTTLANDDGGVRALNSNLAKVGTQLAGDRKDLGAALSNLATALSLVNRFVADNRSKVTGDVHRLTRVSRVLQSEKEAITQVVDDAGEAVTNLSLAGDPKVATQQKVNGVGVEPLDTKADLSQPLTATGKGNAACQLFTALGLSQACALVPSSAKVTGPGLNFGNLLKVRK
jgi:virulence factor Mce-like protein